jgi:hypothetical protein
MNDTGNATAPCGFAAKVGTITSHEPLSGHPYTEHWVAAGPNQTTGAAGERLTYRQAN